jgi:serine/threonine-protein kinase
MGVIAISIAFWGSSSPTLPSLRKLVITPSSTAQLGNSRFTDLAISPDGSHVVYFAAVSTGSQLYARAMDELTAAPLPGTEGVDRDFFISPNGEWVAFVVGNKLKKVSLVGGAPITLCDVATFEGGSWGSEDTIVFAGGPVTGLYRVSANGGQPESLAMPDIENGNIIEYQQPEILPGGKAVLFAVVQRAGETYQIAVLSLDTGGQKTLLENGRQPHYLPTGHLVYELTQTGTLMAVPFDLERLEISGNPVPVFEGVRSTFGEGTADYSIADDGTLIYASGGITAGQEKVLVWVDRKGATQQVTEIKRDFEDPRLSPDGTRLSVTVLEGPQRNVWIYEISRGILAPFTFEGSNGYPSWTPDGERITFASDRGTGAYDLFWMLSDGSGEAERLMTREFKVLPRPTSHSWSPEGVLAFQQGLPLQNDIWVLPLEGEGKPHPFLVTEFNEQQAMFSPDGKWIALTSDRSGQSEVYVKAYPGPGGMVPISSDGGTQPMWAHSGKELFYRNGDKMMAVSVRTEPAFEAETPTVLFEGTYSYGRYDLTPQYDVSPDDQQFVMVKESSDAGERPLTQIIVVQNWFEELKRLVPTP